MEKEYFDRVISLGQDCGVADALRKIGYRELAYPFDWNVTTLNFIKKCFKSKFKILEQIFSQCTMAGDNQHLKYTGTNNDSIYFAHEDWRPYYSTNVKNNKLNFIKDRYVKRGLRLHNLLNEGKKILFIRKAPNDKINDIINLKNIIIENYPNLNFKILLINNINNENVNDERIIHKYKPTIKGFITWENDMYHNNYPIIACQHVKEELLNFDSEIFSLLDPGKNLWHTQP